MTVSKSKSYAAAVAQKSSVRKKAKMPLPLLPLKVNNLQRRRYESTMEVDIANCNTGKDLKNAIEVQKNLAVIALLYRGVPLDDTYQLENLLLDLEVGPPRFAVHTRVRPHAIQGGVTINVVTLCGTRHQVSLRSMDTTLLELREIIKGYEGMLDEQFSLLYQGRRITGDHSTLRACNLCTMHLILIHRGGGGPLLTPRQFVNMEDASLLRKFCLGEGPDWRVSEPGLSVEGKCRNENCVAHNQMVVCNLNFTVFNLHKDTIVCPICRESFVPVTCGFRKCLWMFEGRKEGTGGVYVASQWMEAGQDFYERFDERAKRSNATWSTLIITTKRLPDQKKMKAYSVDGECPICYDSFNAFSSQCALECKHSFHRECLQAWQRRGHSTCPMCRESMV